MEGDGPVLGGREAWGHQAERSGIHVGVALEWDHEQAVGWAELILPGAGTAWPGGQMSSTLTPLFLSSSPQLDCGEL